MLRLVVRRRRRSEQVERTPERAPSFGDELRRAREIGKSSAHALLEIEADVGGDDRVRERTDRDEVHAQLRERRHSGEGDAA